MKLTLFLALSVLPAFLGADVAISPSQDPFIQSFSTAVDALPKVMYYPSPYPPSASAAIQFNTTSSPILAVSPQNPNVIICAMNQDPMLTCYMSKTNTLQLVRTRFQEVAIAASSDGGSNWKNSNMPLNVALGGTVSDGVEVSLLRYSYHGKTLFAAGRFSDMRPGIANRANPDSGIWIAASSDDAASWQPQVISTQQSDALDDFQGTCDGTPDIACDPDDEHTACLVWDRPQGNNGNLFYSATSDSGAHWSAPKQIYDMKQKGSASGVSLAVAPNKTLVASFMRNFSAASQYPTCDRAVLTSSDFGSSWSKSATQVSPFVFAQEYSPALRIPRDFTYPPLDGSEAAHMAVSPNTGRIYLLWQAGSLASSKVKTQSAHPEIVLSVSSDNAKSWTKPVAVSQTYAALSSAKLDPLTTPAYQAFNGNIVWLPKDLVGIIYYDHRNYQLKPAGGDTDVWLAVFREVKSGGSTKVGLDFVKEYRLTANSFNSLDIQSDSYITAGFGKSLGIAACNSSFACAYAQVGQIVSSQASQCQQAFCAHIDLSQRLTCFYTQQKAPE